METDYSIGRNVHVQYRSVISTEWGLVVSGIRNRIIGRPRVLPIFIQYQFSCGIASHNSFTKLNIKHAISADPILTF